ncbi:hypothetical protein PR048_030082 [Dryococelus australis]|uniref:Uncharacterized protein n=1 Tax=Dryococelus australis TaxID=614101 RepID=A0ABQ9GBT6_9NEOP|nr:hypothetical protein PR048_030082 [Dryococelus australis]
MICKRNSTWQNVQDMSYRNHIVENSRNRTGIPIPMVVIVAPDAEDPFVAKAVVLATGDLETVSAKDNAKADLGNSCSMWAGIILVRNWPLELNHGRTDSRPQNLLNAPLCRRTVCTKIAVCSATGILVTCSITVFAVVGNAGPGAAPVAHARRVSRAFAGSITGQGVIVIAAGEELQGVYGRGPPLPQARQPCRQCGRNMRAQQGSRAQARVGWLPPRSGANGGRLAPPPPPPNPATSFFLAPFGIPLSGNPCVVAHGLNRKPLKYCAVFLSHCLYLRDFKMLAGPLRILGCIWRVYSEMQWFKKAVFSRVQCSICSCFTSTVSAVIGDLTQVVEAARKVGTPAPHFLTLRARALWLGVERGQATGDDSQCISSLARRRELTSRTHADAVSAQRAVAPTHRRPDGDVSRVANRRSQNPEISPKFTWRRSRGHVTPRLPARNTLKPPFSRGDQLVDVAHEVNAMRRDSGGSRRRVWSSSGINRRGKRETPEKNPPPPTASSGTISTCETPVARPGIEPDSHWWEASRLTTLSSKLVFNTPTKANRVQSPAGPDFRMCESCRKMPLIGGRMQVSNKGLGFKPIQQPMGNDASSDRAQLLHWKPLPIHPDHRLQLTCSQLHRNETRMDVQSLFGKATSQEHDSTLGPPLVDDRPMMKTVKYRVVSCVVWTNRTMHLEVNTLKSDHVYRQPRQVRSELYVSTTAGTLALLVSYLQLTTFLVASMATDTPTVLYNARYWLALLSQSITNQLRETSDGRQSALNSSRGRNECLATHRACDLAAAPTKEGRAGRHFIMIPPTRWRAPAANDKGALLHRAIVCGRRMNNSSGCRKIHTGAAPFGAEFARSTASPRTICGQRAPSISRIELAAKLGWTDLCTLETISFAYWLLLSVAIFYNVLHSRIYCALHCLTLAVADFPSAARCSSSVTRNSATLSFFNFNSTPGQEACRNVYGVPPTIWKVQRTPSCAERTRSCGVGERDDGAWLLPPKIPEPSGRVGGTRGSCKRAGGGYFEMRQTADGLSTEIGCRRDRRPPASDTPNKGSPRHRARGLQVISWIAGDISPATCARSSSFFDCLKHVLVRVNCLRTNYEGRVSELGHPSTAVDTSEGIKNQQRNGKKGDTVNTRSYLAHECAHFDTPSADRSRDVMYWDTERPRSASQPSVLIWENKRVLLPAHYRLTVKRGVSKELSSNHNSRRREQVLGVHLASERIREILVALIIETPNRNSFAPSIGTQTTAPP